MPLNPSAIATLPLCVLGVFVSAGGAAELVELAELEKLDGADGDRSNGDDELARPSVVVVVD